MSVRPVFVERHSWGTEHLRDRGCDRYKPMLRSRGSGGPMLSDGEGV